MSDTTSLEASSPASLDITRTMLEQIRSNHEEIECLERVVMQVLKSEQTSPVDQLLQGHRLRSLTSSIIINTEKLVETYETKAEAIIKDEIPPLSDQTTWTNVSSTFFHRLEQIREFHRMHPSERLVYPGEYEEALLVKEPLIPLTEEIETDFEDSVSVELRKKNYSLMEAKVKKLCNSLDEAIKSTKQKVEKRQNLAFGEMEEEEAHRESEKTMGWDNKPIPYWLHKLGLGQEYKCKICRNSSIAGKRAFERHFEEWHHQSAMHRLETTSTEEFNSSTSIEEANELQGERMPQEGNELGERMPKPKRQRLLQPRVVEDDGNLVPVELANQETEEKSWNQVVANVAIPPQEIKSVVKRTAGILSTKGQEFEKEIIAIYGKLAVFSFLESSNLYHSFFLHKLAKYRAQNQEYPARATERIECHALYSYSGYGGSETFLPAELRVPRAGLEAHKFTCRLPCEGITRKELDVIKLTAQYWARYGTCFWEVVREIASTDPEFKFMKPADGRRLTVFKFKRQADGRLTLFEGLVHAYGEVLRSSEKLKEEVRKNAADVETVLENCYYRVQWEGLMMDHWKKARDKKGPKKARIDGAFVHLLSMREMALRPAKPDPNRPKIDESELVPEDEFLAQQPPGCATIWVHIPKAMDACAEISVSSLLETVETLKVRIHKEINIAVYKQEISGKTGVLKDNKSLAYYNVGAGEMLTMAWDGFRE